MKLNLKSFYTPLLGTVAATLLFSATTTSAQTVAHYRFEDGTSGDPATTAQDSSPNGYHLDPVGNSLFSDDVPVPSILLSGDNNTLSADFIGGGGGFASVDDEGLSNVALEDFTIEAWVKRAGGSWATIIGRDDRNNQNGDNHPLMRFQINGGGNFSFRATMRGAEDAPAQTELNTVQVPVNEWVHLAAVADLAAQTLTLYMDGQQVGQLTNFTGLWAPPGTQPRWTIGLGQWIGNPSDNFNGLVDEVRISSEALAPSEFLNFDPSQFEIASQPADAVLWVGEDATFSTEVFAGGPYSIVWETSTDQGTTWSIMPGETGHSISIPDVDLSMDRTQYRAIVTRDDTDQELITEAASLRVGFGDVPEPEGVVAHYRFEGTPDEALTAAQDSVGGHHMSAIGSPTYGTELPFNFVPQTGDENTTAVELGVGPTATNAFVDDGSLSELDSFGNFTIEAWVQFDQLTDGNYQIVVGRDDLAGAAAETITGNDDPLFRIQKVEANTFMTSVWTSADTHLIANGQTVVETDRWYHVASVGNVEAGTLSLYVDGQLEGSVGGYTGMHPAEGTDTPWTIGRGWWTGNGGPTDWVNGRIDEVRFSDRALPPTEFLSFNPSVLLFITQPQDVTAHVTDTITFTAVAGGGGTGAPTYQWQVSTDDGASWTDIDGTLIDGRTEYTIEAATLAHDGNQYRVVASRADREEISRVATLTLDGYPLPQIVQETPAVLLAFVGDHIVLNVEATGQGNITYEWSGDDGLLGTGPSLDLGNVDTEDAGIYTVVVSDDAALADGLPATTVTLSTELILIPRPAEAISLNFVGSAGPDWDGALDLFNGEAGVIHPWEEAGVVPVANWNNSPSPRVATQSEPFELVNDLGEATSVTATWQAGNAWGALNGFGPVAEKDADQRLFHGYIEGRPSSSVTISNIEFDTYDVFVYPRAVDGSHGQNMRRVTLTDAAGTTTTYYGRTYIPSAPFIFPFTIASATTQREAAESQPVTVFRYTGVTGATFTILHEDVIANPGGIAAISIVDTSAGSVARPVLTSRPESRFAPAGSTVTFSVEATSAAGGTLSYQWSGPDGAISGATTATLTLTDVSAMDSGVYTVEVSDSAGSINKAHASLSVADGPDRSILVSGDMNYILLALHDAMSGHGVLRVDGTVVEVDPATAAENPHEIGVGDTVWNRLAEWERGLRTFTDLVDHEGLQLPGLALTIDAPTATAQDVPDGGGIDIPIEDFSGPLLRDYIFTQSGETMSFTLSGLGHFAGREAQLVVYSHGPSSTTPFGETQGETDDIATVTLDAANSPTGEAQSGITDAVEGRDLRYNSKAFVAFDVVIAANGTVNWTISGVPEVEGLNAFNGFQLLLTDEGDPIEPDAGIEEWRMTHFGSNANSGNAANSEDADGDGLQNLLEYALGTIPTDAGSGSAALTAEEVNGFLTLSFNHIDDASLIYSIEATDDLALGWTTVHTYTPFLTTGTETYVDDAALEASSHRFLRLKVTLQK